MCSGIIGGKKSQYTWPELVCSGGSIGFLNPCMFRRADWFLQGKASLGSSYAAEERVLSVHKTNSFCNPTVSSLTKVGRGWI